MQYVPKWVFGEINATSKKPVISDTYLLVVALSSYLAIAMSSQPFQSGNRSSTSALVPSISFLFLSGHWARRMDSAPPVKTRSWSVRSFHYVILLSLWNADFLLIPCRHSRWLPQILHLRGRHKERRTTDSNDEVVDRWKRSMERGCDR